MNKCPVCGSTTIGRIGPMRFFCGHCFLEFAQGRNRTMVYCLGEDGGLRRVGEAKEVAEIRAGLAMTS